jgi:hypothetical protein
MMLHMYIMVTNNVSKKDYMSNIAIPTSSALESGLKQVAMAPNKNAYSVFMYDKGSSTSCDSQGSNLNSFFKIEMIFLPSCM